MKHSKEFINKQIRKHYSTGDLLQLSLTLGLTIENIRVKAGRLGLKRVCGNDLIDGQFKYCPCCKQTLDIGKFNKDKYQRAGYDYYCRDCRKLKKLNKMRGYETPAPKERIVMQPRNMSFNLGREANPIIVKDNEKYLKCKSCEEVKPLTEFHKDKGNKHGHKNYCKECLRLKRLQKL